MMEFIKENGIKCPNCGSTNFTDIRKFNLMFKTFQGVTEDARTMNLSPSGNGTGHFCQLLECTTYNSEKGSLWRLPNRKIIP